MNDGNELARLDIRLMDHGGLWSVFVTTCPPARQLALAQRDRATQARSYTCAVAGLGPCGEWLDVGHRRRRMATCA